MVRNLVFICFIITLMQCQGKAKLILLEVIFRHGDRAPKSLYPNDPNPAYIWQEGLGKLTSLGRKQHYELGKFLRFLYKDFVTSNPNEVTVNSTEVDRCLRSAQSMIASFYEPTSEWSFDDSISWQPIPVHYIPLKEDKVLSPEIYCPEANAEILRIIKSDECQKLLTDHQEMFKNLSSYSGMDLNTIAKKHCLFDTLFVEKKYNLIIPSWVDPYWNELSDFARKSLSTCKRFTPVMQRLRAGLFIGKLIEDMNMKISGQLPDIKVRVHSAHEANLKALLTSFNVYNKLRPPYCATILFELHELIQGQHAIRLLYLNSTTPENMIQKPHVLILDGCYEYCPLDYFIKYTKHLIPDNWERECGLGG